MNPYEKEREANIERNKRRMSALAIPSTVDVEKPPAKKRNIATTPVVAVEIASGVCTKP